MSEVSVLLDHPPMDVRPNGRASWRKKAAAVQKCRLVAAVLMRKAMEEAGIAAGQFEPETVGVIWYYFGQPTDVDNCLSSCKAYIDGCFDSFRTNDRVLRKAYVQNMRDPEKRGKVKIIFTTNDGEVH